MFLTKEKREKKVHMNAHVLTVAYLKRMCFPQPLNIF